MDIGFEVYSATIKDWIRVSAAAVSMAMAASPPTSPGGVHNMRPQSMYVNSSPEQVQKPRPHSLMMRPPRSTSRLSIASSKGEPTRLSDEDVKTTVKVGK